MALRLIQIKLPDAEHDSIFEIIADQKFVTTWPDHRVSSQLILQLVAPTEACEAIIDQFEQRFQGNPEYHILLLLVVHGSPWRYDTYVPILFGGNGIKPQTVSRRVDTVDVAPTLANIVGAIPPSGASGEVLLEVLGQKP